MINPNAKNVTETRNWRNFKHKAMTDFEKQLVYYLEVAYMQIEKLKDKNAELQSQLASYEIILLSVLSGEDNGDDNNPDNVGSSPEE